jgi:hypothetical protein
MRRSLSFTGILVVSALLLGGCASGPSIDYDPSFDFSVAQSFDIADPATAQTGDPRIDSPLINKRIHTAIDTVLVNRGYRAVSDSPAITVHYRVSKRSGVDSRNSGVPAGIGTYRRGGGAAAIGYNYPAYDIVSYEEGVLTIDVIHTADNKLVWRGSSSRRLGESGTRPEAVTTAVNEVVAEILEEFPPGKRQQ